MGAFFGQSDRTAICVVCAVFQFACGGGMEMPVKEDVSLFQEGGRFGIEQVSVRKKEGVTVAVGDGVIGENGKFENHLVNFAVAVASYAEDFILDGVEHSEHLFRGVLLGEIVSRSVIEKVAEQNELVCLAVLKGL